MDKESSLDLMVYFLLFPYFFKKYLRRNIDKKSSLHLGVIFFSVPYVLNRYLRRNIENKSSLDRRTYLIVSPSVTCNHYSRKTFGSMAEKEPSLRMQQHTYDTRPTLKPPTLLFP